MGKKLNTKLAKLWVQENRPILENEFSHLSVTEQPDGASLEAESANLFKFYASGRVNCTYFLATIEV
jgi:hypothetical protein